MLELRTVTPETLTDWLPVLAERLAVHRLTQQYRDPVRAREIADERLASAMDRATFREIAERDRVVGFVAWMSEHDDLSLLDVHLDEPDRVAELLSVLTTVAGDQGCRRLAVGAWPRDETRAGLAALPGFTSVATNMLLELDVPVEDPDPLVLRPMTPAEFDPFYSEMITGYAAELAASGMSEADALHQASSQSMELIPNGVDSPLAEFFVGWIGDEPVGRLWIGTERPMAFVYELEVLEAQRRKGYGEAIMNAGSRWCQERGIFALGLNVFGHNPGARALYDKLDYVVTEDYRALDLADVD